MFFIVFDHANACSSNIQYTTHNAADLVILGDQILSWYLANKTGADEVGVALFSGKLLKNEKPGSKTG